MLPFGRTFLIALVLTVSGPSQAGEILRLSRVSNETSPNVEKMELKTGDNRKVIFVSKATIITEDHVEDAWPQSMGGNAQIGIKLNEAGRIRLAEETGAMNLGSDRIAFIIDGKLEMAPVIQDRLRDNFVVLLGRDAEYDDAASLAQRILGKDPREIKPQDDDPHPTPKRPETRPFTDDEYQELKAQREKMGLHYLDEVPSEEALNKLNKGMSKDQIITALGQPTSVSVIEDKLLILSYECADERLPPNPDGEMRPTGVTLHFDAQNKTYASWSYTTSNAPRAEKVIGRPAPVLKIIIPEVNMADPEFDLTAFIEDSKIPDFKQNIGHRDLYDLLGLIETVSSSEEQGASKTVSATCDIVRFLAHYLTEFEKLLQETDGDRVKVSDLRKAAHPYMWEGKALPALKFPDAAKKPSE